MRSALKTVRLHPDEAKWVDQYLQQNFSIGGFSDLARLAILDFIQKRSQIPLQPVTLPPQNKKRPSFLWDYDLDKSEVKAMLLSQPFEKKSWLIARILNEAPFSEVWEYLTPQEIRNALPKLRMNQKRKNHWEFALGEWLRK
jgi:hypothetical protein